jgi:hypothetical protein
MQEAMEPKTVGRTPEEILKQQEADAERDRMERMRAVQPPVVANSRSPVAAQPAANAWVEVSTALDQVLGGPLLKFTKQGEFVTGSDANVMPAGTRCVARVDEVQFGWCKWIGGEKVDQRMGRTADRFCPPQRSELGDTDRAQWEVDDGKPKDPWQFQTLLPVTRLDTDETFDFVSGSKGGLAAVNKLVRTYGTRLAQGKDGLPIVDLRAGDYKHRTYGKIFFPVFAIVNYTSATGAPATVAEDLQDAIPF